METISSIKDTAKSNSVPILQDDGIKFICDYIRQHNVKNILEIGTAVGYSAIEFASVSDDIFVSTIEIDLERYHQAIKNIHQMELMDRITVYLGNALTTDISGTFDLIFIDAAKSQYIKFFEKFKDKLAPNGIIITDNLNFHGMVDNLNLTQNYSTIKLVRKIRKYIDFLNNNKEFTTTFYPIADGLSVSKKN